MNLAMLDRSELESIVLDPPAAASEHLICSDNTIAEYIPQPVTLRQGRLRHVLAAAHELLTRIAADSVRGKALINAPAELKNFLRVYFAGAERESFVVVYLDATHRVIEVEELFAGTISETRVYPREIVKRVLHFVCVRPSHLDPGHETVVSGQAAGDQRCGSSSSIRLAGCVGSRSSTSLKYA